MFVDTFRLTLNNLFKGQTEIIPYGNNREIHVEISNISERLFQGIRKVL